MSDSEDNIHEKCIQRRESDREVIVYHRNWALKEKRFSDALSMALHEATDALYWIKHRLRHPHDGDEISDNLKQDILDIISGQTEKREIRMKEYFEKYGKQK